MNKDKHKHKHKRFILNLLICFDFALCA